MDLQVLKAVHNYGIDTGYYPMFDISTIYYIDYTIQYLSYPRKESIDFLSKLRNARDLFFQSSNDPYFSICSVLEKIGYIKNPEKKHLNICHPIPDSIFIRMLFGLISMTRLIEAICLGDKLIFCGGHYYDKLPLEKVSKYLKVVDDNNGNIWDSIKENDQQTTEFLNHQKDIFSRITEKEEILIKALSCAYLHQPLVNLWGCLHDASTGQTGKPIVHDTFLHDGLDKLKFSSRRIADITDDFSRINKSNIFIGKTFQLEFSDEWLLMHKYLMNSLNYHALANYYGFHYVSNDLREPFLYSLDCLTDKEFIKDKIIENIHFAVKEIQKCDIINSSKRNIRPKSINKRTILFLACLSLAKDTTDIIPAAYRLRNELKELRNELRNTGDTNDFDGKIENDKEKIIL